MELKYVNELVGTTHFFSVMGQVKIFSVGNFNQLVCPNTGNVMYFEDASSVEHIQQCVVPRADDGYGHIQFISSQLEQFSGLSREGLHVSRTYVELIKRVRGEYGWKLSDAVSRINLVLLHLGTKDAITLLYSQYGSGKSIDGMLKYVRDREKDSPCTLRVLQP